MPLLPRLFLERLFELFDFLEAGLCVFLTRCAQFDMDVLSHNLHVQFEVTSLERLNHLFFDGLIEYLENQVAAALDLGRGQVP